MPAASTICYATSEAASEFPWSIPSSPATNNCTATNWRHRSAPGRIEVQGALGGMQQYLSAQGASPTTALQQAYGLINLDSRQPGAAVVVRGRLSLSWRWFVSACVPIVFALKKAVAKKVLWAQGIRVGTFTVRARTLQQRNGSRYPFDSLGRLFVRCNNIDFRGRSPCPRMRRGRWE